MDFGILFDHDEKYNINSLAIEENIKTLTLHQWQRKALDYFLKNNQILAEVATGSGKTFFAIEALKKILDKEPELTVLILVPKNVILERVWFTELLAAGFTIKDIGVYYGKVKEPAKITITNIQSIQDLNLKDYDMLICDELHNYGTKRALNFISQKFKYKIGLTATLERLDKKHYDLMECFGYHTFKYNTMEALTDNVINFFDFFSISLELDEESMEEYEEMTGKINFIYSQYGGYNMVMRNADINVRNQLLGLMNNRKQLVNNYEEKFGVLKDIVKKNPDDKILVFNQFNKQTNACYWELLDMGVSAKIIHSGIKAEDRDEILNDYKNDKFNVLLTSKVLDEGYSLPSINTVVLMSNDTGGQRQLIQRVGRSLRKKKDGSFAKVYLIYVKDTIEENENNIELLRDLCSTYEEHEGGLDD